MVTAEWMLVLVRIGAYWAPIRVIQDQAGADNVVGLLQGAVQTKVVPCRVSYDPAEVA